MERLDIIKFMDNDRLLKGFNYFWDLKPSQVDKMTVIYLHKWLSLLKESVNKSEAEPVTETDINEFAINLFRKP